MEASIIEIALAIDAKREQYAAMRLKAAQTEVQLGDQWGWLARQLQLRMGRPFTTDALRRFCAHQLQSAEREQLWHYKVAQIQAGMVSRIYE